jgi:drug/metabolite transporter (DMT)-like permease
LAADLLLLAVTAIWGTTFVIVKNTISVMGPMTFLAMRFLVAAALLLIPKAYAALFVSQRTASGPTRRWNPPQLYVGAVLTGRALLFADATQTLGLVTVTAGKAAFITGFYVVLVPIASKLLLKEVPDRASVLGVVLATFGLALLSLRSPFRICPGDFLILLCAVGFAAQILLTGRYGDKGDSIEFTAVQLLVVSLGSFVWAGITERPITIPAAAWPSILFTASAATSFAFLAQTMVQRYTSATHTALIYSAEPVFGALFAWLVVGEALSPKEILGAVCILGGMVVSERASFGRGERAATSL